MFGYILAGLVVFYFFAVWPFFEGLPPKSKKITRYYLEKYHVATKFGLYSEPAVGEIYISPRALNVLCSLISYMNATMYTEIVNSQHFYLTHSNSTELSLYCTQEHPKGEVTYKIIEKSDFIKIPVEERILIQFLKDLSPQRR